MVRGSEGELFKSMIDPYEVCGRLCTKCGNLVRGRCAKIKRVTTRLATRFVCSRCRGIMEGTVDSIAKLCDEVETVNGFLFFGR